MRILETVFKTLVALQRPFDADKKGTLRWDSVLDRLSVGTDDWRTIPVDGDAIRTRGSAPTVTTLTAAGTTAAITTETYSTDMAGRVELTPGGTGITSGPGLHIAFARALADANFTVLLTAGTSQAAAKHWHTSNRTASGFDVSCVDAMVSAEVYGFHYLVIPRFA